MDEEVDKLRPLKKRKFKTLELLERLKEAGAVGEISRNEIAPGSGSGSDSGSSPVRQKGPPKNPKRKTTGELELLEKTYAMETYPSRASRAELSEKLGFSDQQLHRWFYRRRLKDMKVGNKAGLSGGGGGGGGVGLGDEVEGVVGEVASGSGSGSSPFGGGHVDLQMRKRYYEPPQAISELRAAIAALVEAQLGDSLMENGPIVGMEFDPLPPRGFGPPIGGGIFDYDPLTPGRSTNDAGSDPLQSRGAFGEPIGGISDFTNMGSKKKCSHCEATKTPQWRTGPMGPRTLCNACGLRYKSGHLVPEYRPTASTSFVPCVHSNYHIGGLSGSGPSLAGARGKPNIGISESDHLSLEAFGVQIDGISDHSPLPIGAIGEPINGIFDSDPLSPGAIGELFDYDPLSLRASGMPIGGISDSNPLPPGALGEPNSGIPDSDRFSPEQLAGPLMLPDSDSLSPGAFSVPIAFNMPTKKRCSHCQVTKTPQWRAGPMGPKTLCNACGVRYRSGRLLPGYRPAASPTFVPDLHSNSHKKVLQMRNKFGQE